MKKMNISAKSKKTIGQVNKSVTTIAENLTERQRINIQLHNH